MADSEGPLVGALGLVLNDAGQVLLVRTATAGWKLPGGRVERDEDVLSALEREVMEEAGCRVAVGTLTGVYSHLGTRPSLLLVFRCRHLAGEPAPGDDSLDARWFAPDDALSAVVHASEQVRLRDALLNEGVAYQVFLPAADPRVAGAFVAGRSARWYRPAGDAAP